MRNLLRFLLVPIVTGCAALKTSPQLDYGFSENGKVLASQTKLTSEKVFINRHLKKKFATSDSRYQLSLLNSDAKHRYAKGFQCFEPYLLILSLGIIPSVCSQDYTIQTQWTDKQGKTTTRTFDFSEKRVVGWAALFVSLYKDWKLAIGTGTESVIYNEINERAEELPEGPKVL